MRNNLFVLTLTLSLFLVACNDGGSGGNGMDSDAAMGMDGGMMMDAATGSDASQDAGPACQVVTNKTGNHWNNSVYDEVVTSVTIPTGCTYSGVPTTVSIYRDTTKVQDLGALPFTGNAVLLGATPPAMTGGALTNIYGIHVTGVRTDISCPISYTVCQ